MRLVVDSSVAVKWFVTESGHREAMALLANEAELIAPDLLIYEVANVVWKKVRVGQMTALQTRLAIDQTCFGNVRMIAPAPFGREALEISQRLDHPVYDCFYLACARLYDCTMVTADARFYRKVQDSADRSFVQHLLET